MLNNLRRKRVQRIDIDEWQYFNLRSDIWWKDVSVGYKDTNNTIGKQRYSKKKVEQSFDYDLDIAKKLGIIRNYINSMIFCASGSFDKGYLSMFDNKPGKKKIEKSFLLGETEITQEIYETFMGENPSQFNENPKNPVECVSWYDALIFCNKLSDMFKFARYYKITKDGKILDTIEKGKNYVVEMNLRSKGFRLPTEWEWEYAAKARTDFKYSGSDNPNEIAWYDKNSGGTTHPVKQLKPNAWGFYDMSGNVNEWCENAYDQKEGNDYIDAKRVIRGGCWKSSESPFVSLSFFSAYRYDSSPSDRGNYIGFRVCRYI